MCYSQYGLSVQYLIQPCHAVVPEYSPIGRGCLRLFDTSFRGCDNIPRVLQIAYCLDFQVKIL